MGSYQKGLEVLILSLGSSVYKDFDRLLRVPAAHPLDPALVITQLRFARLTHTRVIAPLET
jgi:hypothetical protein